MTTRGGKSTNGHLRNGGGRPKIDWVAARSFFVRDPRVGYGDVAKKFSVSDTAVRRHAREEHWEDIRAERLAVLDEKAKADDLRSLEERRARTIAVAEKARDAVLDQDVELDPNRALSVLPALAKHEELMAGEATDRIDVADVREIVRAYNEAFMATIPLDYHERYDIELSARLAAIRARFPKDDEDEAEAA